MPLIAMIVVLTGAYGYTGGGPVIQGFKTIAACERAVPAVQQAYGPGRIRKVQCLALSAD